MRHLVINEKTNEIVNVIEWDGITQWQPEQGFYSVPSNSYWMGEIYDKDNPRKEES